MLRRLAFLSALGVLLPMIEDRPLEAQNLTVQDILRLPQPPADRRIAYGSEPQQFGDLRLPEGEGPHPVVIVIHGGCWRSQYGLDHISSLCAELTRAGAATWSLEYRRIGDPGGGWPGTFEDVARGADHLRAIAPENRLDLDRVVAVGHSAGGHLALWLAGRSRLPAGSPLHAADPLALNGVVGLAAVSDLERSAEEGVCGDAVPKLLGGMPGEAPDHYRWASPMQMLPLRTRLRLVHGARDDIVPLSFAIALEEAARQNGDDVRLAVRDEAAHFELIAPETPAGRAVIAVALELLER